MYKCSIRYCDIKYTLIEDVTVRIVNIEDIDIDDVLLVKAITQHTEYKSNHYIISVYYFNDEHTSIIRTDYLYSERDNTLSLRNWINV